MEYSAQVSRNVNAALERAGISVLAASGKTGIPRTTLARHLSHPETSPFDVIELSLIAKITRKTVSSLTRVKEPLAPADPKGVA